MHTSSHSAASAAFHKSGNFVRQHNFQIKNVNFQSYISLQQTVYNSAYLLSTVIYCFLFVFDNIFMMFRLWYIKSFRGQCDFVRIALPLQRIVNMHLLPDCKESPFSSYVYKRGASIVSTGFLKLS